MCYYYTVLIRTGISPLYGRGVFSCDVGMVKPEPGIYRELIEKYALTPEEFAFLDDFAENVAAARNGGMKSILFNNCKQARTELESMLSSES